MKNVIALLVISGAIALLMYLAGNPLLFVDAASGLFLILFLYAATIVSFGTHGMFKSVAGLKYLFGDEIVGGSEAKYLASMYKSQVKFLYGGAFIGLIVGAIAIYGSVDTYEGLLKE